MNSVLQNTGVTIKTPAEIEAMRAACQAAASVLIMIEEHVRPGVTTGELDRICREYILGPLGCQSATIGYTAGGSRPPFPGAICTSVKDRKSTRLNSSHVKISYAVFCLKKKTNTITH